MDDRLHQQARAGLLPWLPAVLAAAKSAGAWGAALSGAGTTVCALVSAEAARGVAEAMGKAAAERRVGGRSEIVEVGVPGARIV
jgi:homoserine kinase